jgi:hypothetical protein
VEETAGDINLPRFFFLLVSGKASRSGIVNILDSGGVFSSKRYRDDILLGFRPCSGRVAIG